MKGTADSVHAKSRTKTDLPPAIHGMTEAEILSAAETILRRKMERLGTLTTPTESAAFLRMRLGHLPHEEFHAVWLDNRHRVLAVEKLFSGTIDSASVYPREVLCSALQHNAAAVIFAHNHPSGVVDPSEADRAITRILVEALKLISVRVLDHFVIGADETSSMAQRGWL